MEMLVVYVAIAVILAILLTLVTLLRRSGTGGPASVVSEEDVGRPGGRAVGVASPAAVGPAGVRQRAGARARLAQARRQAAAAATQDSDEDGDVPEGLDVPEGAKLGAKKLRKLQEKAERRQQREVELEGRQEQLRRETVRREEHERDEARLQAQQAAMEEEERKLKEEKERLEHEEYLKMKELFSVEEEGTHEAELNQDGESILQEFIDYIQGMKVVMLEDLAAHFKLQTQEAIDRVVTLQSEGRLSGVLDDRGKFISITQHEYEQVAKFISQRGRVSICELAESSNQLINLKPDKDLMHRKLVGESEA